MIMKKQLLLLVMMLLPMVASADAIEIDGIWYNLISKAKIAEVTEKPSGYYSGTIEIPEKVSYEGEEYNVTKIGSAFSFCTGLTSITIPNTVTTIGGSAFWECSGLTSITIPNSVTSIEEYAFYKCSGLTSVTIPNSVTSIEEYVFYCCSSLASITIPNSVTSIGKYAFYKCSGLTSITIPNSVTSIGRQAFCDCSSLTSVTIPNSVTSIGQAAFGGCSGMTSITISNNVTNLEGFSGCTGLTSVTIPNSVTSIEEYAFQGCSGLTSIVIPNSVKSIKYGAFQGCSGLTSITIPNSVTSIWSLAFAQCQQLTDVYCLAENVPNTNADAFNDSYIEYATLHVPDVSVEVYKTTDPWKNFKEIVKIMPMFALTYIVDDEMYKSYQVEEGVTITPEPALTKEGYTFSGWSEIPETMPAHDVTVTGSFSINSYKLTYIVDGEEYKNFQIDYGTSIAAETEPTKEGYTFSGWSEIPETMPAHDVTVTGTFSVNSYKLTYTLDGEEYKSYEVEYGTSITAENEPTKEGYTFSGWSDIPETMPANDVTVTGSFTVNKYQVTYIIDGEVYATDYVDYGATIVPPSVEEKKGLTFSGWTDVPETMPAHDLTIYGSFTSGIAEIVMATKNNVRIYSPNGKKIDRLQKGLNIVVLKDGTVKKIVVK